MFQAKLGESTRSGLYSIIVLCLIGIALFFTAKLNPTIASTEKSPVAHGTQSFSPSATFPGTGVGPIPDGGAGCDPSPGEPLTISYDVSGIGTAPGSVEVSITFASHSYLGDVTAQLYSPDGTFHTVFGNTGSTTASGFGDNSDLGATYVFRDNAPAPPSGGWWQEAAARGTTEILTAGTYRTTAMGGVGQVNPAPPTSINAAFAGIPTSNGTWTLLITDGCAADTGSVSASSLTLGSSLVNVQHVADFNGDGKTDFTVARGTLSPLSEATTTNTSPILLGFENSGETKGRIKRQKNIEASGDAPLAPPIYWYTYINGTGAVSTAQWGDAATDFIVTEDFDGDSKSDLTVWRPGPPFGSNFFILQSATNTVRFDTFGQEGDDPAVVGDYDGDGKADPAVYRCPSIGSPAGQCYFFYRSSVSGQIIYNPWGFGNDGDFFPYVGDFDGDGKNDFCIQRTNPSQAGQGQFVLLKSGGGIEYINWGNDTDFLIPGDYDGDGKTDLCVRRTVSGARAHYVLTRTGAIITANWGITGDSSVPGDYDGDGKTDFAIWRGSVTPGQSAFYVLNSGSNSVSALQWGQCPSGNCDYAVAGWPVH